MIQEQFSSEQPHCPLSNCLGCEGGGQQPAQQGEILTISGPTSTSPWFSERVVEVRRPEVQERIVEVPHIVPRERIMEERRQILKEKVKFVPKYETVERVSHVPKHISREVVTFVPQVQVVERTVEVPTTIYQDVVVPVAKPVVEERITHIPKPVVVGKVVEIPRIVHRPYPVERIVEVPQIQVQYKYKDIPVSSKVIRQAPASVQKSSYKVAEGRFIRPSTVRWRQHSTPVCAPSTDIFGACCNPETPRVANQENKAHTSPSSPRGYPVPARWYTTPIQPLQQEQQPVVVEGLESVADEAGCCSLTPRQHTVKRRDFVLSPNTAGTSNRYNVKVATLSREKAGRRLFESCCGEPMRTASLPSMMRSVQVIPPEVPRTAVPLVEHASAPLYQYEEHNLALKEEQEIEQQVEQQQEMISSEPWMRTKFGDMPFAEFEKLNNENSLASSRWPVDFTASYISGQMHDYRRGEQHAQTYVQTQPIVAQAQHGLMNEEDYYQKQALQKDEERQSEHMLHLQQQKQRREEERCSYEQQEQKRLQQLQLLTEQRRQAEERRERELQELQQRLQQQREQKERELQQRLEEEKRKRDEERQKWIEQIQQEKEHREKLQKQQQQKQLEELMQIQEKQRQDHEERKQRCLKQQEQALSQLLAQQQKQQKQLQEEFKGHNERLQAQQELLRAQQEQALRQLQQDHLRQQQRLETETQRKTEAFCSVHQASDPKITSIMPPKVVQDGPGELLIQTRFGAMPYSDFVVLNQAGTYRGFSSGPALGTSTISATSLGATARQWQVNSPRASTVYARVSPSQKVVHRTSYPIQYENQQYYYNSPAPRTCWIQEANKYLLPSAEQAAVIQSEARRIGQDAAVAGSHVYGGVKNAVNSELAHDIFRSVGELVSDAYHKMRGNRR
ncbi:hypothetical protein cyc_01923 [Cyclospora cayetanensis]|uniref:Uncharacterized protein n=1 Tax=Cyclospora cayetanensis TaxID=88456 RepID=A0A1D3CSU2_9EIME|nr:hypothetical protein cyc_01923 [Cyclospora cayetanensis]